MYHSQEAEPENAIEDQDVTRRSNTGILCVSLRTLYICSPQDVEVAPHMNDKDITCRSGGGRGGHATDPHEFSRCGHIA